MQWFFFLLAISRQLYEEKKYLLWLDDETSSSFSPVESILQEIVL